MRLCFLVAVCSGSRYFELRGFVVAAAAAAAVADDDDDD